MFKYSKKALEKMNQLDESLRAKVENELKTYNGIVGEDIINNILEKISESPSKIVVNKPSSFIPLAKEYSPNYNIDHRKDVTGKSRTESNIKDFLKFFRNRFERISRLFPLEVDSYERAHVEDIKHSTNRKVKIIAMVYDKMKTKKGNLLLKIEDLTGMGIAIVVSSNLHFQDFMENVLLDDIIMLYGTIRNNFLIVDDIRYPPISKPNSEPPSWDVGITYISDVHIGSSFFLKDVFKRFIDWLSGKYGQKEVVSKIKYLVIGGDLVDGIGIFPNQEETLNVKDIYKQYEIFNEYMELIPDYITIFAIPGNHDAVRRGEPSPSLKEFLTDRVISLGNPSFIEIENITHLLYHGTSLDSIIGAIPRLSYEKPEDAMYELLKRRHLSPIYGTNPIVPEHVDYLVVDKLPDVFLAGHVHKNGFKSIRNILLLNAGTFQSITPFQIKMGHIPTPGNVFTYFPLHRKLISKEFLNEKL